jgi:hypothetical protein
MSASLEAANLRGQATRDAQTAIATTWVWDEKTLAQWIAELIAINTKKVATSDLEADMLAKRATYESGIVALHERTVEGLGMGRVKWRKDEAKKHILSTLSASGGGRETVQSEAQAWESVWEKFDAAWNPSPLNTLAAFRTLITDSDSQENFYKKAHTDWRTSAEELSVLSRTLWEDAVAWYEAATTLFKEGTAIGDMIRSTIPTSPTTPVPTPLEMATATAVAGGSVATTYIPGGGAHATVVMLQWKVVGVDADFGHDTTVNEGGQTVATGGAVGAVVQLRVRTTNSTGTTFSTVKTVTLV